ncbi:MAG: hypothetical protein K0S00_3217 [Xanthobacteraceae bacterium]|jgi:Asp-tRNA(Asn)/Glu-tRNA(Gln) amidotransferase A subunit family amidase|nr:hypothetical protein [Xanthobacteraceae bacterium]
MTTLEEDVTYLTAKEAIAQFKAKMLSPVELLKAQIDRIEACEPVLNALTLTLPFPG